MLLHGVAADTWVHQDLWTALADELQCLQEQQLVPHWIPSHLDEGALESPYEDWVRVQNDQADRQAGVANLNRPHALLSMQSEAIEHHRSTADRLRQLKSFSFKVASQPATVESHILVDDAMHAPLVFDPETQISLQDLYNDDLQELLLSHVDPPKLTISFVLALLHWVLRCVDSDCPVYDLSWEEFPLILAADSQFCFPFWSPTTGPMELFPPSARYEKATLVSLVSSVRLALRFLVSVFPDFDLVVFKQHSKVPLGITRPCGGIFARLLPETVQLAQRLISDFTLTRQIRRSCDLARPV